MRFVSSGEVTECSASDLVGESSASMSVRPDQRRRSSLKRLWDASCSLTRRTDSVDVHLPWKLHEVVGLMTRETFASKIAVILTGYDLEMNHRLAVNTASRATSLRRSSSNT